MKEIYQQFSFLLSKKAKRKFIWQTFLCIVCALFETLGISLIFPYITVLTNPELIYSNKWLKPFWEWLHLSEAGLLPVLSVALILIYIVKNLFLSWFSIIHRRYILEECFSTTQRVYQAYLSKPYLFFLNSNSTDISNLINVYISKAYVMLGVFLGLFSELFITVFLIIFMIFVDPGITFFVILFYGMLSFVIKCITGPRLTKIGKISNDNFDQMVKNVTQAVRGIQDVKLLRRESVLLEKYSFHVRGNISAELKMTALSAFPKRSLEVISVVMMLLCVLILHDGMSQELLFAQLSTFALVLIRIMPGINHINSCLNQISYYKPSLMKLQADTLLYDAVKEEMTDETAMTFEKEITVENLSFGYTQDSMVLKDICLSFPKGSVIGIRGVSGGGKTTFANLLLGLLAPDQGKICVDGNDISQNTKAWYGMISYIPQAVFLLDGTVLENIVFYREAEEEKAWEALEKAQLKEFVETLPQGIHTSIGERGVRLSGGQRQRLGIARAIYYDAEIFVFDEPTAALDQKLEEEVMNAIYSLKNRTIFLIAHRLNTLRHCDTIYEVKDGKVTEVANDNEAD